MILRSKVPHANVLFPRQIIHFLLGGSEDDGEKYGGGRILKIMQREGVLDAVVIVSRWSVFLVVYVLENLTFPRFGGTLLGPIRFTHIENCTHDACVRFKAVEEIESCVERLQALDQTLSDKRAALAGDGNRANFKPQDYSHLLATVDITKARRLLKARESAIKSLEVILKHKRKGSESNMPTET